MGYFLVGSETSQRIFVDRPTTIDFYYLGQCYLITEDIFTMLRLYRSQWPLYLTTTMLEGYQIRALPGSQACVNCTLRGGVLQAPEYWTE